MLVAYYAPWNNFYLSSKARIVYHAGDASATKIRHNSDYGVK